MPKVNIKLRRVSYLKLLLGTFKDKSESLRGFRRNINISLKTHLINFTFSN